MDQKFERKMELSPSESSHFENLFMLEPKQCLHHHESEYLYFKIKYILTQIVYSDYEHTFYTLSAHFQSKTKNTAL